MAKRILIGGASLAGKSSLAAGLSERLGWETVATDFFARHPGRPWRDDGSEVPPHVVEHFLSLTPQELLVDVLRHYRSLSTRILEAAAGERVVIEGSAVLPELMPHVRDRVLCVLVAEPGVLTRRISSCANSEAAMKFAARAELMNAYIALEAERLGLPVFDAEEDCVDAVLTRVRG